MRYDRLETNTILAASGTVDVTLLIVFIGMICDYYFGTAGAILGASVAIASLSKAKVELIFPSLLLIGSCWGAGQLLAGGMGGLIGVVLATFFALWLEKGVKSPGPAAGRARVPTRERVGS